MNHLNKEGFKNVKITIGAEVIEINIDLRKPRIVPIKGRDKKGKEVIWHLKVTEKGRLVLI